MPLGRGWLCPQSGDGSIHRSLHGRLERASPPRHPRPGPFAPGTFGRRERTRPEPTRPPRPRTRRLPCALPTPDAWPCSSPCCRHCLAALPRPAAAQVMVPEFWGANGPVYTSARWNDRLYLGGAFDYVGPHTGSGVPIELSDGSLPGYFPQVNGTVNAVVGDPAGGWYIGGSFTTVGSFPRNNVAKINSRSVRLPVEPRHQWGRLLDRGHAAGDLSRGNVLHGGRREPNRDRGGASGDRRGIALASRRDRLRPDARRLGGPRLCRRLLLGHQRSATQPPRGHRYGGGGGRLPVGPGRRAPERSGPSRSGPASSMSEGRSRRSAGRRGRISPRWPSTPACSTRGIRRRTAPSTRSISADRRSTRPAPSAPSAGSRGPRSPRSAPPPEPRRRGTPARSQGPGRRSSGRDRRSTWPGVSLRSAGSRACAWRRSTPPAPLPRPGAATPAGMSMRWPSAVSGSMRAESFGSAGGVARNRLAEIDLSTGRATNWNPGASSAVLAIAADSASVFVGGTFNQVGGASRQYVAQLDPVSGLATAWNPAPDNVVNTIALAADRVYVGGEFLEVGATPRHHLAAIDRASGVLTAWNPDVEGLSTRSRCTAIASMPEAVSATSARRLARTSPRSTPRPAWRRPGIPPPTTPSTACGPTGTRSTWEARSRRSAGRPGPAGPRSACSTASRWPGIPCSMAPS